MFGFYRTCMSIKAINLFNINKTIKLKEPEFDTINGKKVIKKLTALNNQNQPVSLRSKFGNDYSIKESFVTEIFAQDKYTPVAFHNYWISEEHSAINGGMMSVSDASQKGKGYGELLRLTSIIDLQENYLDRIAILALNEAVPFHHKYKFKPCIPFQKYSAEDLLMKISNNNKPELNITKEKAINLLDEIQQAGLIFNTATHNRFTKSVNKLISEYLDAVETKKLNWESTKEKEGASFRTDIEMVLNLEDIYHNKDFFNERFQKHGIDYEI